jgi:hypothetical protein
VKTTCPFCNQEYDIEEEHFGQRIECSACNHIYSCTLVATPLIGPLYVDIETTGLSMDDKVTSVVWWCDNKWHSWVNGLNDPSEFHLYWKNAPEVITFNGRSFDEPRICRLFSVDRSRNHTDLLAESQRQGMSGGLKELGAALGFPRPAGLEMADGLAAIRLWERFRKDNDAIALENLLYYNAWDVVLTYLLHMKFLGQPPLPIHESIPFRFDREMMQSVLPKPRQSRQRAERQTSGQMKQFWEDRKKNPLTTFRGAEVCFTGDLVKIERDAALELITSIGGIGKWNPTRTLDFLVVGDTWGSPTGKVNLVQGYIGRGAHTRIINEDEFWEMVAKTRLVPAVNLTWVGTGQSTTV